MGAGARREQQARAAAHAAAAAGVAAGQLDRVASRARPNEAKALVTAPIAARHQATGHLGTARVDHAVVDAVVIAQRRAGCDPARIARCQGELKFAVGRTGAPGHQGRAAHRPGLHCRLNETCIERKGSGCGGRAAEGIACAQRVAAGAERPDGVGEAVVVVQPGHQATRAVVDPVAGAPAAIGRFTHRQLHAAVDIESVVNALAAGEEPALRRAFSQHGMARRLEQREAQRVAAQGGAGVARHRQQVVAVARHSEGARAGVRGITLRDDATGRVIEPEHIARPRAAAHAQPQVSVGAQVQVKQLKRVIGCQVGRHRRVHRDRLGAAQGAQGEACTVLQPVQGKHIVPGGQPLRRQRPTAAAGQGAGQAAIGLHATGAAKAPRLVGVALPFQGQQAVGREVKLETRRAAVAASHGDQGIQRDERAAIGGQVCRCSVQGQRGRGGKRLPSRRPQPHVTGGVCLVELRLRVPSTPQQATVGVEGRHLELPIDSPRQLKYILARRRRVPQRALPHSQAREGHHAPRHEHRGRRRRCRRQRERLGRLAHAQLVVARRQIKRRRTGPSRLGEGLPIGDRALRPDELPLAVVGALRFHKPKP